VAAEKGYKNNAQNYDRAPIHPDLEDIHYPTESERAEWELSLSSDLPDSKVFVLADGHGGVDAARFFVPRCKELLTSLLLAQPWDFSIPAHQEEFEHKASNLFRLMDAEYCAHQVERYRRWVDSGSKPEDRPLDDGCTMVATVIHNNYFVNLNVGDSRTVISSRPTPPSTPSLSSTTTKSKEEVTTPHLSDWAPVFTSVDHNMTHPQKVWDIHTNGGHFLNPNGSLKYVHVQPPADRGYKPYFELNGGRIYRHPSDPVRAVGVSHRRTLNLTATMGDLLFKVVPAVLSPVPDVRFVRMEEGRDYMVVMATDGVWDHLVCQGLGGEVVERQNAVVLGLVAGVVESFEAEQMMMGVK
ncbi:hypothetical protein HDV05_002961, partial [Chytridiales sp. JEL 0842]